MVQNQLIMLKLKTHIIPHQHMPTCTLHERHLQNRKHITYIATATVNMNMYKISFSLDWCFWDMWVGCTDYRGKLSYE